MERDAWLPNLTSGVSIWSLARDLNRPALFDGRLLVPRVEGAANLPSRVEWIVTGLVPLEEARATHAAALERAIDDFARCVERALVIFEQEGFAPHRAAFTLPSFEGSHYYFGPEDGRLYATNWGASPRKIAQRTEHVVDALRFRELARGSAKQTPSEHVAVVAPKRRRAWLLVSLGIPLLLLAGLALLLSRENEPRREPPRTPPIATQDPDPPPRHIEPPPPLPAPHQKIYFARGDHALTDDQRESLQAIAAYLRDHPEVHTLLVEGHADFRGDEPDNLTLSGERALRVRGWLESNGVDASRLACAACSELHPLEAASENDEGQRANRRVEFFVLDPPAALRPHEGCAAIGD